MNNIDNTINNIGLKIKYYRNLNNISLSSLAKEANISKSTLFGLEEGRSNPTISTLINIAKTLNIKLDELISENTHDENRVNFTLISKDEQSNTTIYKLSLLPNEFFQFNQKPSSQIELEILNGLLVSIDNSKVLEKGSVATLEGNSKIKALSSGATAIVKIKGLNEEIYIKNDLFFDKPTKDILQNIVHLSKQETICRAIFRSIYPIEHPKKTKYVQIIEQLANKEVHYYIFSTLCGLSGAIENIINKENLETDSKFNTVLNFIKKTTVSEELQKRDFYNIPKNPINYLEEQIALKLSLKYNAKLIKSVNELTSLQLKKDHFYILTLEELSNSSKILNQTVTLKLYRALELMIQLKEQEMDSAELNLYTKIREKLPKAFYFAINQKTQTAIFIIEQIIKSLNDFNSAYDDSLALYIEILKLLKEIKKDYEELNPINTKTFIENTINDLNLKKVSKMALHPAINGSGKYIYILKA